MARETKTKTITGKKVMVTQFPALDAARKKTKLLKMLLAGGASINMDSEIDYLLIAKVLIGSLDKLGDDYSEFLFRLFACTLIDGDDMSDETMFNEMFAGNLVFMYKVIGFILEANYSDFLSVKGIGKKAKAAVKEALGTVESEQEENEQ